MGKLFEMRNLHADGWVLPYNAARLFSDKEKSLADADFSGIIALAEEQLQKPVPFLPASLYREYAENGNRNRYEGPYFTRRNAALVLALAEYAERAGRFTDLLIDYLWAICDEATWVIPAHNNPRHGKWQALPDALGYGEDDDIFYIDLFAAATGADLALIVHLVPEILDRVTPVIRRRILGRLRERILTPFYTYSDSMWWQGSRGNTLNNWTPWIVSNVLTTILLTETAPDKRTFGVEKAMVILDRFTRDYPEDGGCDEGPSYWGVAGASYFDCLEVLYDLTGGRVDIFDEPLVKRMGEYIADFRLMGDTYVNFADAPHRMRADARSIARIGRRVRSDKLTAMAASLWSDAPYRFWSVTTPYRLIKNLLEEKPETAPYTPENRIYYPDLQVFIAKDAQTGLELAAKGGHNAESHNHNDVGNIVLFRGEEPVFIDGGVATYTKTTFSDKRYTLWTMRSVYHNLPVIGGVEERAGREFAAADPVYDGGRISYALTRAYPAEAGIERYRRTAYLTDNGAVVVDELALTGDKAVSWHWMTVDAPRIDGNTLYFPAARVRVTFTSSSDEPLTLSVVPVDLEGDGKLIAEWKRDMLHRIDVTAAHWRTGTFTMMAVAE